jgi:hypothetical protein
MKRSAGVLSLNSLLGAATILGGVSAAICLGRLLSAGDELRSSILLLAADSKLHSSTLLLATVSELAADGAGDELRSSFCCPSVYLLPLKNVASCLLLLKPTAMCLSLVHSEHLGLPHGLTPYFPPVRGGMFWCIFYVTILWCMSWYVWTSCKSLSAPWAPMCTSSFARPSARSLSFASLAVT